MNSKQDRETRVRREIALLEKLKRGSAIFDFHWTSEPTEQLLVTFNGKGIVTQACRSIRSVSSDSVSRDSASSDSVSSDSVSRDSASNDSVSSDVEVSDMTEQHASSPDSDQQTDKDEQSDEKRSEEGSSDLTPQIVDVHRVSIALPDSFPTQAPEVRWETQLLHPNVSFSGIVDLEELGSPWQPELTLDVLCDRLWDVVRLAYVNLPAATNNTAKHWYENECTFNLPVDARPLRNRTLAHPQNVVSYRRIGKAEPTQMPPKRELLYIGDDPPQLQQPAVARPINDRSLRQMAVTNTEYESAVQKRNPREQSTKTQAEDDGIYFVND